MEGFKALVNLAPVLLFFGRKILASKPPNDGFAGLFVELMFVMLVLPALLVLGGIHLITAWLLLRRKVPSRALIVTADILEGGAGLCVLMLSFSPTVAVWILFCAVELFTVLSRTGNDYWSSASSPSSASSTSATSG